MAYDAGFGALRRPGSTLGMGHRMAGPKARMSAADIEAAEWHGRLGGRNVDARMIEDFFTWRQSPANAEAYRRVETVWSGAGKLAADPQVNEALEAAFSRRTQRRRPPRLLLGLAAVGAAAALAGGFSFWLQSRTVFSTGVGEERLVQLADGSSVRLDTASRVRVRFDGDRRFIELQEGQAFFTVAHDAGRPFVVAAGDAQVTALGTVFDVRREAAGVKVVLVSGAVEVADKTGAAKRMTAGQQARVTKAGVATRAADVDAETGWIDGRIVFRDAPLRAAVAEVNRYLPEKIVLDETVTGRASVNGVFRTGDRDAFVSTATEVFDLKASAGPGGTIVLTGRSE